MILADQLYYSNYRLLSLDRETDPLLQSAGSYLPGWLISSLGYLLSILNLTHPKLISWVSPNSSLLVSFRLTNDSTTYHILKTEINSNLFIASSPITNPKPPSQYIFQHIINSCQGPSSSLLTGLHSSQFSPFSLISELIKFLLKTTFHSWIRPSNLKIKLWTLAMLCKVQSPCQLLPSHPHGAPTAFLNLKCSLLSLKLLLFSKFGSLCLSLNVISLDSPSLTTSASLVISPWFLHRT